MKIAQMFPSKYVSGKEMEKPVTGTIAGIETAEMRPNPASPVTTGYVLRMQGWKRGVVLTKPLAETIAQAVGDDDTDHWPGKKVTLFPQEVTVAGRKRIAIRARKAAESAPPSQPVVQKPEPTPEPAPVEEPIAQPAPKPVEEPVAEPQQDGEFSQDLDPRQVTIPEGIGVPLAGKTLGDAEQKDKAMFLAIIQFLSGNKANAAGLFFKPEGHHQQFVAAAAKKLLEEIK